uniref:Uncharacterized protein n=1 Tax=viral metagenome TaxID=1070528 RepID=A0A6C0H6J9_9ZZZZ
MNNTIYYMIMTHGGIPGKVINDEFVPNTFTLPNEVKYFNKITKVIPGSVNICYNGDSVYMDYYIKTVELLMNKDIVGKELSKQLKKMHSHEDNNYKTYFNSKSKSKTNSKTSSLKKAEYDLLKNKVISFSSIDNLHNKTFINKVFQLNKDKKRFTNDIRVLKQNGGLLYDDDYIMKMYFNNTINMKTLVDFSLKMGYNNIIIIDLSCESLYLADNGKELTSSKVKTFRNMTKDQYWGGKSKTR